MSLLELQERVADAVFGEAPTPELERYRRMVRAKRRRELHDAHPLAFHHVPGEVVERYLDAPEGEFADFAAAWVTPPVRDALAAELHAGAGVYGIDLHRLRRGELAPAEPRWWLVYPGRRPVRLWRARAAREYGG